MKLFNLHSFGNEKQIILSNYSLLHDGNICISDCCVTKTELIFAVQDLIDQATKLKKEIEDSDFENKRLNRICLPRRSQTIFKGKGISLRKRFFILKRDGYVCQICGRGMADGVKLEVDHKSPKSISRDNSISNLWTLCFDCNRGKLDDDL